MEIQAIRVGLDCYLAGMSVDCQLIILIDDKWSFIGDLLGYIRVIFGIFRLGWMMRQGDYCSYELGLSPNIERLKTST